MTLNDIKPSLRKYPFVDFKFEREIGREILKVENLTKKGYFENVSFMVKSDEKIAFLADKSTTITMLFDILMGKKLLIVVLLNGEKQSSLHICLKTIQNILTAVI